MPDVVVGNRHRKDMGDIGELADSIAAVGLLHPPVLTEGLKLVVGARRLEAVRKLGWDKVPCLLVADLDELLFALRAEQDENTCRKDFDRLEAVSLGKSLMPLEKKNAAERKEQAAGKPRGAKKARTVSPGKFPEQNGQTRDRVGKVVGMSGKTFERAEEVADKAKEEPEKYGKIAEDMRRTGNVNGAFKKLKKLQAAQKIKAEPPPLPKGPFRVLVIDPPWAYDSRASDATHRAANPYPSMTVEQIAALPVARMAHEDCVLWLWTTNAHLPHAFGLLRGWGFEHKTVLTWVKDRMGTGDWLRGQTEHCLLAVRGRPTVTLTNQTTVIRGPLREHSRKPDTL
jgi:hypothetical protein